MKKFLGLVLMLVIGATGAFAQGGADFALRTQQVPATDFSTWRATSRTPVTSGSTTITINQPALPTVPGWNQINPWFVDNVILVDAENGAVDEEVTITAVSCSTPTVCTITASFSNAHSGQYSLRSGTFGVNEAIKQVEGMGGGQVVIPADFGGVTGDITGAVGSTAVQIHDLRSGTDAIYGWSGSAYVAILAVSNTTTSVTVGGLTAPLTLSGSNSLIIGEGTTVDAFETTIAIADPTASDKTATFPDATGTVMLSTLATNAPDVANSVTGASAALVFEGATADAFETSITATDPTADRTITLPNASITVNGTVDYSCGTTSTCSPVDDSAAQWSFSGSAALVSGTPSAVTITGFSPAFTSTATYTCIVTPVGASAAIAAAGLAVGNTSASSITITGPDSVTTVANYSCKGK